MDESIVAAGSVEEACRASQRVGYIWQYLDLQDALRKRRMAGQDGGPWIRTKVHIIYRYIYQMIGEGKWAKTRIIIKKWMQRFALGELLD